MTAKNLNEPAKLLKALGNPVRLKMVLAFLENEKNCLCEIQPTLKLSQPTLSRHLGVLRNCGALECKKVNNRIYYKVKDKRVHGILKALEIKAKGKGATDE